MFPEPFIFCNPSSRPESFQRQSEKLLYRVRLIKRRFLTVCVSKTMKNRHRVDDKLALNARSCFVSSRTPSTSKKLHSKRFPILIMFFFAKKIREEGHSPRNADYRQRDSISSVRDNGSIRSSLTAEMSPPRCSHKLLCVKDNTPFRH